MLGPVLALALQGVAADRLPGDLSPPALEVMLAPPSGRPPPPPDTTLAPPMSLALEAAQAALAACMARDLRIGVAVTDTSGQLRVGLTSEGAGPGAVYAAVRKTLAAMAFREPTSRVQARLRQTPADPRFKANMAVKPGAVPLMAQERLVGAIGVSGGTAQQDEACAAAGAAAIKDRLH